MVRKTIISIFLLLASCACMNAQDVSFSTNVMDYANMGTLNLAAGYGFSRHWSVNANVKYNPFEYDVSDEDVLRSKQRSASVGVRYWPWNVYSGWWLSSDFRMQEYNMVTNADRLSYQGDRLGYAMGAGYSYMIGRHFNLDMGLGFWTGYETYSVYACPHCGRKIEDGAKSFVMISDIILAISFIF